RGTSFQIGPPPSRKPTVEIAARQEPVLYLHENCCNRTLLISASRLFIVRHPPRPVPELLRPLPAARPASCARRPGSPPIPATIRRPVVPEGPGRRPRMNSLALGRACQRRIRLPRCRPEGEHRPGSSCPPARSGNG